MRLNVVNKITANQEISEKIIRGKKHTVVHGVVHMITDTVMNGIFYPKQEVELLCVELEGKEVTCPAEHPTDDDGNFMSASSPMALISNFVGAFAFNFSMRGDKLISDMAICPELASMNEYGEKILTAINDKLDMDMSTGFYLTTDVGGGVAPDGNEFMKTARNLKMDHSALLPVSLGAKQSKEGVGMFANSALDVDGNSTEMETFIPNMAASQLNLPLSARDATDWLESKAIEDIKNFTQSGDKPSSNYRKFFAYFDRDNADDYESYFYPFAVMVDGRPMAHPQAIEDIKKKLESGEVPEADVSAVQELIGKYEAEETYINASNSEKSMFKKFMDLLKGGSSSYNTDDSGDVAANSNEKEGSQMRKTMMSRMIKNGGYKQEAMDNMSDDEMMNAYGDMMKKSGKDNADDMTPEEKAEKEKEKNAAGKDIPSFDEDRGHKQGKANSQEMPEWAKGLMSKIDNLETTVNSNVNAEIDQYAEAVANAQGITKEQAKTIPLETLKQMAANAGFVNGNIGSTTIATNSSTVGSEFDKMEAPE